MDSDHQALESRVGHLDREVSGLVQGQAGLVATVQAQGGHLVRLGEGVDRLIELHNQPKPQIQVWVMLGGLATLLVVLLTFIELRTKPIEEGLAAMALVLVGEQHELNTLARALGKLEAHRENDLYQARHLDEGVHKIDERLRDTEKDTREALHAQEALLDYIKMIDEKGSRRWTEPPNK